MQLTSTSPKVPPSKTIHDQLRPFRDLPLVRLYMHFPASASRSRLSGPILFAFIVVSMKRSRESRKTKVDKASSGFVDILKVKLGKAEITVIGACLLVNAYK